MKFLILNGPNLNMLGIREPGIYGNGTYEELKMRITDHSITVGVEVEIFQSNHEGVLVDKLQESYFNKIDGIVINPAAYTHTSVALLDALKSIAIPTVEVHISKVEERENFRQVSYVRQAVIKTITGKGFDGYLEAIDYLKEYLEKNERKSTKG
ncbi:MAG: type II 3-dehydroquinate dehydratase [Clostridia bacterium]|nr:type II 3-dehydroquinate dehydratase [Clostridia bacterium]